MAKDIKRLIMLAKQNNAEALNELGYLYFVGSELKQDYSKAFNYYSRAAELGLSLAYFNLGILYAGGFHVEVNGSKTENYYKIAAEKGLLQAQYSLAR